MGGASSTPKNPDPPGTETNQNNSTKTNQNPPKAAEPVAAAVASTEKSKPKVSEDAEEVNFKVIHSAFRWNKPPEEIEPLLTSAHAVNIPDPNNGNTPIHIAAQNGHNELVKLLIRKKADLNAKNGKGNTGLHMAIGYDYYETAMLLINNGADQEIVNEMGVPAKLGLEGNKALGIACLVNARNASEVLQGFELCEAIISKIDRANFAQAGLKAKKTLGGAWTSDLQDQFKEINAKLSQT